MEMAPSSSAGLFLGGLFIWVKQLAQ
ncbi:PEP-CTERM sorting domain-containing protein [Laceyella tengchongensis]|nr:PEP-CTERM sorting domain-containing protein [Laceyella tengchongensis]